MCVSACLGTNHMGSLGPCGCTGTRGRCAVRGARRRTTKRGHRRVWGAARCGSTRGMCTRAGAGWGGGGGRYCPPGGTAHCAARHHARHRVAPCAVRGCARRAGVARATTRMASALGAGAKGGGLQQAPGMLCLTCSVAVAEPAFLYTSQFPTTPSFLTNTTVGISAALASSPPPPRKGAGQAWRAQAASKIAGRMRGAASRSDAELWGHTMTLSV